LPLLPAMANRLGLDVGPLNYLFQGMDQIDPNDIDLGMRPAIDRPAAFGIAAPALYGFLLVRYGIRGVLDFKRIWRPILFGFSVIGCVACGYRSTLLCFLLTFIAQFYLEGAHKTKLLPAFGGVMLLSIGLLLGFSSKLPWTVQRTLSFLPIKVDGVVERDAKDSNTWRIEMWKVVLPDVPKYFFKGKGFTMNEDDLFWARTGFFKNTQQYSGTIVANDYHNGPLSVIIPFGIFGVIGFVWLLGAGIAYLYRNYRFGDPNLKTANTALLAIFIGRILMFFLIFGSFYSDLFVFTGLLGLSVSLNGKPVTATEPESELGFTPFSSIADGKNSA
jgi:hypothetical protein